MSGRGKGGAKRHMKVLRDNISVVALSVASRLLVTVLIVIWWSFLKSYDTSAALNPPCLADPSSPEHHVAWPSLASALESLVVWDGVYFVRIAQCGYEYEQSYAFLPLLPLSISLLARSVFAQLVPIIGYRAVLALSGYVINNIAFVLATLYLYKLSVVVLKDRDAAFLSSILFCFNPASVFYSSIYSESLYGLYSVGGLYYLVTGKNNLAVFLLALSGASRSNGVINAGYICFQTMNHAFQAFSTKTTSRAMQVIAVGIVRCVCIFVPFLAFQVYGYYNMCLEDSRDRSRPWCNARIPLLYNYIQSHYWGVGFLRYFKIKQLPNFLLATPILSLAFCAIVHYAKSNPGTFFSLGFHATSKDKNSAAVFFYPEISNIEHISGRASFKMLGNQTHKSKKQISKAKVSEEERLGYGSVFVLPFVLHLGFLGATAFFVMHVQVATRFLSSSPPIYWFAAYLMANRRWGYVLWAYCVAYILLGTLLFSNFYPFT